MSAKNSTERKGSPKSVPDSVFITKAVIAFLRKFITETMAKRLVGIVLIAAGIPDSQIREATGLSAGSLHAFRKILGSGNIDGLFVVGYERSGKAPKTKGFEEAITDELNRNSYRTRQQIADMILDRFGISLSVTAVARFLKKNRSKD